MKLVTPYRTKEAFVKALEFGQMIKVVMCPKRKTPILGPIVVRGDNWQALVTLKGDRVVRIIS